MRKHGGKIFSGRWISKHSIQSVDEESLDVAHKTSHLHIYQLPLSKHGSQECVRLESSDVILVSQTLCLR